MSVAVAHRGPDDAAVWLDRAAGIGFGFRRLAVVDRTDAGRQPIVSSDGRYVCVFNGEVYNQRELRASLTSRGVRFRSACDSEVVVEAAAAFGPFEALSQLWGMFALAVWDRRKRSLLLARDRLGQKPLYLGCVSDGWLFASEPKAFRAVPSFSSTVDQEAVSAYLRLGYVPTPLSIYCNASKLVPGTSVVIGLSAGPVTRRYWNPREHVSVPSRNVAPADAVEELADLAGDAVGRRMLADVPLGVFLSGGVDSSLVAALAASRVSSQLRTYSVGFDHPSFDETPAAVAMAAHLRTRHTVFRVSGTDALDVLPVLAEVYDEPFGDGSQIPTFLLSRWVRPEITVALSGDGADELFAGYPRYRRFASVTQLRRVWSSVPAGLRRVAAASVQRVSASGPSIGSFVSVMLRARAVSRLVRAAALVAFSSAPDRVHWDAASFWSPQDLVSTRAAFVSGWERRGLSQFHTDLVSRSAFYDAVTYLPDDILVKVDRASMAHGLEVRSPFLDHRLVEWAWRLPWQFKLREGTAKWVVRRVLSRYVPPALAGRPKTGFSIPVLQWLRGPLREWAASLLSPAAIESVGLRPSVAGSAWNECLHGSGSRVLAVWVLLMLLHWSRRWT